MCYESNATQLTCLMPGEYIIIVLQHIYIGNINYRTIPALEYFQIREIIHFWVLTSVRQKEGLLGKRKQCTCLIHWPERRIYASGIQPPARCQTIIVARSAPSHYLNKCLVIANWTLAKKLQWIFNQNSYIFIPENTFENVVWKMVSILLRPQCVIILI